MKKGLILIVFLAMGLMFGGCATKDSISASNGTVAGKVTVQWEYLGGLSSANGYDVYRNTDPLPPFPLAGGTTWTKISPSTKLTVKTFDDTTAVTGTIYFYIVVPYSSSTAGKPSWPDGGYYGTVPKDGTAPVALKNKLTTWEAGGNCIHVYTELLHPDPASELPIHEILSVVSGEATTGTLALDMVLLGANLAVAEFSFNNGYSWTCTNGDVVDGYQYAPVDPTNNYNGFMSGWTNHSDGWQTYELDITGKHSSGGIFYVGDGTNGKAVLSYSNAPWQGCLACTTPSSCLCP